MMEFIINVVQLLGSIILLVGMVWFVHMSNIVLEEKEKQESDENL